MQKKRDKIFRRTNNKKSRLLFKKHIIPKILRKAIVLNKIIIKLDTTILTANMTS